MTDTTTHPTGATSDEAGATDEAAAARDAAEHAAALATTIDLHLRAYGEPGLARRAELVRQVWAADGVLVDPPIDGAGHDGIVEMAGTVQSMFPGHTFRRTTQIDEHHGIARYGWELLDPTGSAVLSGVDVAECADDGTLRRVAGFFGDLVPID